MSGRSGAEEARAWRALARDIDAKPIDSQTFLCVNLDYPRHCIDGIRIDPELAPLMRARLASSYGFVGCGGVPSDWREVDERTARQQRILACLWLAHEAESDQ